MTLVTVWERFLDTEEIVHRHGQSLLVFTEPCYNKIKLLFLPMEAETISDSLYLDYLFSGKQVSPCSYFQLSYK